MSTASFFLAVLVTFISTVAGSPMLYGQDATGTVIIEVEGLRNSKGSVLSALFDNPTTFPNSSAATTTATIDSTRARLVYEGLTLGAYVISVLHDENGDEQMQRNSLGMPTEGFGFSNNPTISFGPPTFASTKVDVPADTLTLQIRMIYF